MSSSVMIMGAMTIAVMALMAFWRKVLMLMLAVAIAVFFYGLVNLAGAIRELWAA